jgi:predicted phage terminase large subunit-like protein
MNRQVTREEAIIQALQRGEVSLEQLRKEDADIILRILSGASIVKARHDFHTYVKVMADELISTGFIDGRHIKLICAELMEVEKSIKEVYEKKRKHAKRKQFFLPPGAMKSLLISVLFVTWFLGRNPKFRVLQIGYSTDFAIDNFGRKVKDIIASSERFRAIFPECSLKSDTRSAQRFELTLGGGYYCTGAGSSIAGRRAHLLVCDDVISEQTAYSDAERTKIVKWYIPGARSRLLPSSSEIIVNTRWHVDDLSAYMEKADKDGRNPWQILRIPAILDDEGSRLLGLPKGHSFWPELYTDDYLYSQRDSYLATGEAGKWSALYMQNPVPEEGNIIKREYICYWTQPSPPECELVIVSVDTAFETTKRADYSAITVWGVFRTLVDVPGKPKYRKANIILLDAFRGKWELFDLVEKLKWVNDEYKPDWFIVEKKTSGISVIQELRKVPEIPLYEYMPDKDKIARVHSALPMFRTKCVWFPSTQDYAEEVITELLRFGPGGGHDDFVDTCSMVINWMRLNLILAQFGESGYDDEDEDSKEFYNKPNTYWGILQR